MKSNQLARESLSFEYWNLTRQAGRMRAFVVLFFSIIFIILGIDQWIMTGEPNILFVFLSAPPSTFVSSVLIVLGYLPLILLALIGLGFLFTTHPTIQVHEDMIKVDTLFISSDWINIKDCLVNRKSDKLLLIMPHINPIFIFNGLWYLKSWKRTVVIDRSITQFSTLYKYLLSQVGISQ